MIAFVFGDCIALLGYANVNLSWEKDENLLPTAAADHAMTTPQDTVPPHTRVRYSARLNRQTYRKNTRAFAAGGCYSLFLAIVLADEALLQLHR